MQYIVSVNTPIEKLPDFKTLSVRSRNLCLRQHISTIGQLLVMEDSVLMRLRNCGPRCMNELQSLKLKYSYLLNETGKLDERVHHCQVLSNKKFWESIERALATLYSRAPAGLADLFRKMVGEPHRFIQLLSDRHPDVSKMLQHLTWKEFSDLRPYLGLFLSVLTDEMLYYDKEFGDANRKVEEIVESAPVAMAHIMFRAYPSVVYVNLNSQYEHNYQMLSQRTRSVFSELASLEGCLPYLTGVKELRQKDFSKCGVKSFANFNKFFQEQYRIFNDTLLNLPVISNTDYYLNEYCAQYCDLYPFLTRDEQMDMARLEMAGQPLPVFYIWYKYVLWSDHCYIGVYRDYFGVNHEHRRHSVEEISRTYNISGERVRQLLISGGSDDALITTVKTAIAELFNNACYCSNDPIWDKIYREHQLGISNTEIMGLAAMAHAYYDLVEADPERDLYMLIDQRKVKRIRLRNVIMTIQKKLTMRYTQDHIVDLFPMVRDCLTSESNGEDVMCLASAVSHVFDGIPSVVAPEPGCLIIRQNSVDIIKVIPELLNEAGHPLSLDKLYKAYMDKYASYGDLNIQSFRTYVLRCRDIVSLGKRGQYALKDWPGIYKGCISDYIIEILSQSDTPVDLDVLNNRIIDMFPKTNRKSISTLLYVNRANFTMYDGGFIGVSNRKYAGWSNKEKQVNPRVSFDVRFKEYCDFVVNNGRLPYSNNGESEGVLTRWRRNIMEHRVDVTPEQEKRLVRFLESVSSIPQNGTENRFRNNCDSVKEIVETEGRLPLSTREPSLYIWLKKSIREQGQWRDNRKEYFDNLIDWLLLYGIDLNES